uniref:Sec1 family domain-containing protein 1 n=1 Tax=Mucochytrium quahogii TaxID=96639 RepID=A0A7S2WKC2_9STRA|mmetsp:Transcript_9391/g.15323  ORF Transcript_9391/g.15323 Transcript_9391/m.15323 type:complete len:661 (+) Transcript_9391:22-2004(+)
MNIRAKELAAVERMLKLEGSNPGAGSHQEWKVLIYDRFCRDVISPLTTVGKLRENGVTLHMLLESPRESIPDVPAVYFIQPTEENVRMFVQDCEKQLYDSAYLNFSSPVDKRLLDFLAKRLVEINAVNVVAKVYDQYLGFVSLEALLFSLNMNDSFARYNNPSIADVEIQNCMDQIANGICAAVATLGTVPIIRCPKGGPAEMVSRKVSQVIRGLVEQQSTFFSQTSGTGVLEQRPMLLIVDRSIDMASPLVHTSGYQTLVDDLLNLGLNRVKVVAPKKLDENGVELSRQEPPKIFTLDKENDSFWADNAGLMIPVAVETHQKELKHVEEAEEKIKRQTGKDASSFGGPGGDTSALLSTVQSLPALLEKKKVLETHLEVLQATMAVISKRQVHRFVELEQSMIFSQYAEKQKILELASDPALELQDKVRFLVVYMLSTSPSEQDVDEVEGAIFSSSAEQIIAPERRGELQKTVKYAKKILSLSRFSKPGTGEVPSPKNASNTGGGLWDLASITRDALKNASRQVKSMVGESKVLTTTRTMDLACKEVTSESAIAEQDAQLLYMDPKISGGEEVPGHARIRTGFNRGILFVVGGGCFYEHQNLQDFANGALNSANATSSALRLGGEGTNRSRASTNKKQYMYGCSQLLNADEFMNQLQKCI